MKMKQTYARSTKYHKYTLGGKGNPYQKLTGIHREITKLAGTGSV